MKRIEIEKIKLFQRDEITEYEIYMKLAHLHKGKERETLLKLAREEKEHYEFFRSYSGSEVRPSRYMVWKSYLLTRIFGLTFGLKSMESWEGKVQRQYEDLRMFIPEIGKVIIDEKRHEMEIKEIAREESLIYISSIVLGLNDALIELTGALAGYTFALGSTREIALVGLITGIAASMSMASSEYLSSKANIHSRKNHRLSAVFTGLAYIATVIILVLPYLFDINKYMALGISFFLAVCIIFIFNYYSSVVNRDSFRERFLEMFTLSLGIAAISFGIGIILKNTIGVDI